VVDERFARTKMLLGESGLNKLKKAKVMIIGLGAVGGYVLEALARSGVGSFILVDFDKFEESNINRQILALSETIGMKKTEVAKQRVLSINPNAEIEIIDIFVNNDTIDKILFHKPDFVVDAIDALNPKCCLIQALVEKNIPFISSMGAALKTDTSKIKFGNLSNSKNCSLAKFVRKRLRKREVDISKIKCVWSEEQIVLPPQALECDTSDVSSGRIRHTLGSLPTITAIFGLTIANNLILEISASKK
jgi:tRNA A37 threonylcarbamoyladenosine dehydratase